MRKTQSHLWKLLIAGLFFLLLVPGTTLATVTAVFHRQEVQVKGKKRGKTQPPKPSQVNFNFNITDKVSVGVPFEFDIWYDATDDNSPDSVHVVMERTDRIAYEPTDFTLQAGVHKRIKTTINHTQSGLSVIKATVDTGATELSVPIDAGFTAKLKARGIGDAIESGARQDFTIEIFDYQGNRLKLDAAVKLRIQSAKVRIRMQGTNDWANTIETEIKRGSTSTSVIELEPQWTWSSDQASLKSEIRLVDSTETNADDASALYSETFAEFKIVPHWWLPLVAAIIGGMVFSLYQLSQELVVNRRRRRRRSLWGVLVAQIAPGALAGALAFLLANWNILGFRIDTTALRGFIVLGFLFSYVGIDTILKLVVRPKNLEVTPVPPPVPDVS